MQKIINGIAIFSGAVALGVVGLGGYVFIRKDAIIEDVKGKIMESVMPGGMSGILGDGAGAGAPREGISNPPSAPPPRLPIPPGRTDSMILLFTLSMIASLRMNTYPPRPTIPSATAPEKIAIPLIIFCIVTSIITQKMFDNAITV